jgi:cephalosporin-C deacetylase-like acetyl esterase
MSFQRLVPSAALAALLLCMIPACLLAQGEFSVWKTKAEAEQARKMLYNYLTEIAWDYLDNRDSTIASLRGKDDVLVRQKLVRERMLSTLGPLPKKTALKAKVTGRLEREKYTIENVVLQSMPGFYVTGNVYVPKGGQKPYPAVLGTCGHSMNGKAAGVYQALWADLAEEGFLVFSFDPPGQGERFMYWDEDLGSTTMEGTTTEHTLPGIQCLLTGANAATYFVWDMIRCIDYLIERPDVDAKRLAVTGNSGGGMATAYLAAMDTRLAAAVPSCYITSWRKLWSTIGPQDAEQNMLPFIGNELDFGDFPLAFAPKPYMMNLAIQDFFNIVGARHTFKEASRVYGMFGEKDKLAKFEADDTHGYSKPRREACVEWFAKHLQGREIDYTEPERALESDQDLWATPTGQGVTSYDDAETMASLNRKFANKIMYTEKKPIRLPEIETERGRIIDKAKELSAFVRTHGEFDLQNRGTIEVQGIKVELISYVVENGITLPALLFHPESSSGSSKQAVLWISNHNKGEDADGDIIELARAGHYVLAPDIRGQGELARPSTRSGLFVKWFSPDWDMPLMAFHVNRSLVGMRANDISRSAEMLSQLSGGARVLMVANGRMGVPALHAAAFDSRIGSVLIEGGLVSWKAVIDTKYHQDQADNVVRGAIAHYDLPALAAAIAPRPLTLSGMADPMGVPILANKVKKSYDQAELFYKVLDQDDRLRIIDRGAGAGFMDTYRQILD